MRELSQSPWRDTRTSPAAAASPASAADEGLAAIMARRRAMADSNASVASPRDNQRKPYLQASPVVDPQLQAAMERRKMGVEVVSPRQNRERKPPRPPLPQAPSMRSVDSARYSADDEHRFNDNGSVSTASYSFTSQPILTQPHQDDGEEIIEEEEESVEEESVEDETEEEEVEEENEEEEVISGDDYEEAIEPETLGYCTTDGEEEMILLDDQTDGGHSSSHDGSGEDEDYPYTTTDDEEDFEEEEFEEEDFESRVDNGGENGAHGNDEEATTFTNTLTRDDSFFQDPGDIGTTMSIDSGFKREEDDYDDDDDENEVDDYDYDGERNLGQTSFMTGLTTLTEERTLDLLSTSDIGEASAMNFENETVYDEQTVQESVFDEATADYEEQTVQDGARDADSRNDNSQMDYNGEGDDDSSESGRETDDEDSFHDEIDEFENESIMEIETLNSSVVSSDLGDVDGWSQDTPKSLLEKHFQSSNSRTEEYDYMFEDGEKSILGELSVLDAVKEEESQDISTDISFDDSQQVSYAGGLPKRNTNLKRATSTQSYLLDSAIPEEGEESGSESDDQDLESCRPNKLPPEAKSSPTKPGRGCAWPVLALLVLIGSVLAGMGVGLFILGFPFENAQPITPSSAPSKSPEAIPIILPDLPSDTLFLYELICPELWPGYSCKEVLLDTTIPSGMAFDWLANNKLANPSVDIPKYRVLQRFALAAFFFATNGYRWTINSNWLSENHECEWYTSSFRGHGCDNSREIFVALELDFNNVQGELPAEISLLKDMNVISLQNPEGPSIKGFLPPSLGALTRLESLRIAGNLFSGGLPVEIGRMTSLQSLSLRNNGFNGAFPSSMALLSSLRVLDLADNHFSGEIENDLFESMVELEALDLSGNKFTRLPDSLASLSNLTRLNVGDNEFRWFPIPIYSMTALEWLDIRNNNFREPIPPSIGRLVNLKYLNLASSSFTGNIPVELGNLVNLTDALDLSSNMLVGSIPSRLGRLTSLQRLLLNSNRLEGSLPPELAFLKRIVQVRFDDNKLEGFVPVQLCDLYEEIKPASYADCDRFVFSECFLYCCSKELGCRCQLEQTDPLQCVSNQ